MIVHNDMYYRSEKYIALKNDASLGIDPQVITAKMKSYLMPWEFPVVKKNGSLKQHEVLVLGV